MDKIQDNSIKLKYSEIAEIADVSVATVSRTLTNPQVVSEVTRQKIYDAIEKAGLNIEEYTFQKVKSKECFILMNLPTLGNPFYKKIINGAKVVAKAHGYRLLLNVDHINDQTYEDLLSLGKSLKISGMIICNNVPIHILKKLKDNFQLVQCCEYNQDVNLSYVSIDDKKATNAVMEYIYKSGRRKIAILSGPPRYKYSRERVSAYCDFLESKGVEINKDYIVQIPEFGYGMSLLACKNLLELKEMPDAIFASSDLIAAAAIRTITEYGLSVPKDITVVGFDNVETSLLTTPTITTVNQPMFQMGYMACEILIKEIENPTLEKKEILLETELIVRAST